MRVLLVEDDPDLADDLASGLRTAGFVVDVCADGEEAWFLGDVEHYALVVLDLGLPGLDGLTILRRWRAAGRDLPVLILTARGDWTEKVEGIESGADDYMAKPFAMGELIARLKGLARRSAGHPSPVVTIGALSLDTVKMTAIVDGCSTLLTPLEFRLLNYLAHQPAKFVSGAELAEHLYGLTETSDTNAIEAIVKRLRRKLGSAIIETRRGFGYALAGQGR